MILTCEVLSDRTQINLNGNIPTTTSEYQQITAQSAGRYVSVFSLELRSSAHVY
jgi:hypothetical protein